MDKPDLAAALAALVSGSAPQRRQAVRAIRTARATVACSTLVDALNREIKDRRRWELQAQIACAMGECRCHEARPFLESLAERLDVEWSVRMAALYSLLLLLWDTAPEIATLRPYLASRRPEAPWAITSMLKTGIEVSDEAQSLLIAWVNTLDPAWGGRISVVAELAAAAFNWRSRAAVEFLAECARSADPVTALAARSARRGTRPRPLFW